MAKGGGSDDDDDDDDYDDEEEDRNNNNHLSTNEVGSREIQARVAEQLDTYPTDLQQLRDVSAARITFAVNIMRKHYQLITEVPKC